MTQEMDDDAEFVGAFEETVNNGRCIDWRYWAKKMPVWTPGQAARLMCALDPDIFENYESQPNANDRSKPIAMAKSIERLAHAQKIAAITPSEWVNWAKENGFSVSPWLQKIVTCYDEEKRLAQPANNLRQIVPLDKRAGSEVLRALRPPPPPPVTVLRPTGHRASVRLKTRTPDWERWSRFDIVRLWQAACLVADIEPLDGTIWAMYQLDSLPQAFHDVWEVINADVELAKLEMLEYSGRMLWNVSLPGFAAWAAGKGFEIPPQMRALLSLKEPVFTAKLQEEALAESINARPVPKLAMQRAAILSWLTAEGYQPTSLPKRAQGLAGPKAAAKNELLKNSALFSSKSFDKAWEDLRREGEISGG